MGVVGWRAYYDPFSTHDSNEYKWSELPDERMVGVVVFRERPYRELVSGGDWYYLDRGAPAASDTTWNGWVDPPDAPDKELKQGIGLPDDMWEAYRIMMARDKAWP